MTWLIGLFGEETGLGLTGLGRGGQQITKCRETFAKAVETLVELASLQVRSSFFVRSVRKAGLTQW